MDKAVSVSQATAYIKNLLATDPFLSKFSVKGEVSNCKYHGSGHIYFTLKDENAALAGVMFRGKAVNGLKFKMKDGDKVVVTGSIGIFEKSGNYQIYADKIEEEGQGDLYTQYLKLKAELEEMGMFSQDYKQAIPDFAKRVGIVTADTGAAIRDIITVSKRRNPYVQLILYPSLVQGEGAAESIVKGIKTLDQLANVDVIIVGRGGGSIEDLWAFNEEIVARAIFECKTPVISAVGHEVDFTIADFVADKRAATPSQAAEFAVCDINVILGSLLHYQQVIESSFSRSIQEKKQAVKLYEQKLNRLSPANQLNEKRNLAIIFEQRLNNLMNKSLDFKKHQLGLYSARLEGLSPLKKLSMGYSFVSDDKGKKVTRISDVKPGDEIEIFVSDGNISAQVSQVKAMNREAEE